MGIRRHWSESDISKLRAMARNGEILSDIAIALNRTESAVSSQAYNLRINLERPAKKVPWTSEDEQTLISMRQSGASYLTIAQHLGRSRQSAIGAGFRLGLTTPVEKTKVRVVAPKHTKAKVEYVAPDGQRGNVPKFDTSKLPDITRYMIKGSNPKSLFERRYGDCCFPVSGDGYDTLYCAEPVKGEKRYCKAHCKVMYVDRPK